MAWLLAAVTPGRGGAAGVWTTAAGDSPPGSGLGSILLSLVGGLEADEGVDTSGLDTTVMGDWRMVLWLGTTMLLVSMMGMLVPGSPGSLFCSSSLSLSDSGPKLEVSCDTFSPSKGSPY